MPRRPHHRGTAGEPITATIDPASTLRQTMAPLAMVPQAARPPGAPASRSVRAMLAYPLLLLPCMPFLTSSRS